MKKNFSLFWSCILLLCCLYSTAEASSNAKAWERVFALVQQKTGYTQQQLQKGNLVYSDDMWAFSLILIEHPEDEDGLLVGQMDKAGNLLNLSGPEKISFDRQLENDLKNCFNRSDCYLRLAEVHSKWKPTLKVLPEDQLSEIFPRYVDVIRLNITAPDAEAIPYDTAYASALQFLAEQPGWSIRQSNMFRLSISAYYAPEDIGRFVYFFYFEQHARFEETYSTDRVMSRYQAELNEAFGGAAPRRIAVMVDAADGSLVEPPLFDYAPVKFHYLDFFIRSEETLLSEGRI